MRQYRGVSKSFIELNYLCLQLAKADKLKKTLKKIDSKQKSYEKLCEERKNKYYLSKGIHFLLEALDLFGHIKKGEWRKPAGGGKIQMVYSCGIKLDGPQDLTFTAETIESALNAAWIEETKRNIFTISKLGKQVLHYHKFNYDQYLKNGGGTPSLRKFVYEMGILKKKNLQQ